MEDKNENLEYDDKWSRLIHAIGKETLLKMQQARILITGLKGLGMEIGQFFFFFSLKKI